MGSSDIQHCPWAGWDMFSRQGSHMMLLIDHEDILSILYPAH